MAPAAHDTISPGDPIGLWLPVGRCSTFARVWEPRAAPAVVLVPGFGLSGEYLVPLGERLAGPFRVYAPDLPGFGRSDRPRRALRVEESAEALEGWIDAAGLHRPGVLANSLGCQVAVDLAARRPVGALVLVSPGMDPATRSLVRQIVLWIKERRTQSPQLRRIVLRDLLRASPIRLARTLGYALADAVEDKLPHVAVPTLVVRGTADPLVSRAWAQQVADLLPEGQLEELADATHAMVHDMPAVLADAVLPFLHAHLAPESGR
ncbi:alpha/beta fold hydrolase [Nonomuraea sp. SYSU D8015]|uniref:alpha/beta fold hydrolase n=1 Tax=Nonomuraea sp. SYSU D8015 TaxID=2593644 RepID=UPI0016612385|nr:alpha/beta hydrolase [Nonomuraea sp. SYSU D8015]